MSYITKSETEMILRLNRSLIGVRRSTTHCPATRSIFTTPPLRGLFDNILKKQVKEKDHDQSEAKNIDVLNMLAKNVGNTGKNIESAVHRQISQLEKINREHQMQVRQLANKLTYIQDNLGLNIEDRKSTELMASELLNMPVDRVYQLVRDICHNRKDGGRNESELMVIMSHLIFRNALNADIFSRIVMKMNLINLTKANHQLNTHPEEIICNWKDDERSRVVCGLALASRYKMLKSFHNAQNIIKNEFYDYWMMPLFQGRSVLKSSDYSNLINVAMGLVDYGYLISCVIKTHNPQFIYSFWEMNPNDGLIRDWLEQNVETLNNKYQEFIMYMFCNASVSTLPKWRVRVVNVSKKCRLSLLSEEHVNKEKFTTYVEMLITEMDEEMRGDEERVEYFSDIKDKFDDLQKELECEGRIDCNGESETLVVKTFHA